MKIILGILLLCVMITPIFAHPGRTASDGCHYCRTNCDKWGVPWNERHCHNTYVAPKDTDTGITYTPTEPVVEKKKVESKPEVKSAINYEYSPNTTSNESEIWSWIFGLGIIGGIIYSLKKKNTES